MIYYDIALNERIPVYVFDALTESMHRILQHMTAQEQAFPKSAPLGNKINLSYRFLMRRKIHPGRS